uniref:Conotoxin pc1b n=1 Tax=Conus pictus TaxID=1042615 RepID=CU1B_CONPB|nr:RecName: Full=Conotoxin pc1b [Conus pictus]
DECCAIPLCAKIFPGRCP